MNKSFGLSLAFSIAAVLFLGQTSPAQNPEAEKIYKHLQDNLLSTSYADCVKEMDRAIALDNKNAVYFYQRGNCYYLDDNDSQALADLDEAIRLNPRYVPALFSRSHISVRTDKPKAIADLKRIIYIDPHQTGAYDVLGGIYLKLGQYDDAYAIGQKLTELAPSGSLGFLYEAESLARRERYPDAIPLYSEAIKRANWDVQAYRGRAEAYRKTGNVSAAEADEKQLKFLEQSSGGGMGAGSGAGILTNPRSTGEGQTDKPAEPAAKVVPAQITKIPRNEYTDEARKDHIQGTVVLRVTFQADGTIGTITVVKGLPDGLTDQAIIAAKKIEFIPATRDGVPVTSAKVLSFSFNIY
jgi:TonB family protein